MLNDNDGLKDEESASGRDDKVPGPAGDPHPESSPNKSGDAIAKMLVEDESVLQALTGVVDSVRANRKKRSNFRNKLIFIVLSLFCLSALFIFQFSSKVKDWIIEQNTYIITPEDGEVTELILDDGTLIKLGEDSQIELARNFGQLSVRKIWLSGQVYLDVADRSGNPFVIQTVYATVTTTGATLNIKESKNDDAVSVIVMKGEASFEHLNQPPVVELNSAQGAIFSSTKRTIITTGGNLENYLSWWTGRLEFENTPLWIITRQLANLYEQKIDFTSEDLKKMRFSGRLERSSLDDVLEQLQQKVKFSYYYDREEQSYILEAVD